MAGIFISYRREDSEDSTRTIYESLRPQFGKDRVFLDVEAIKPGSDFRDAMEEHLADCGVCLVVIGPTWLNIKPDNDPSAPRRLDNPGDFVRLEVATALKKGKTLPVIPVLVRGASAPTADQLPDDLQQLAFRNAVSLNHSDWETNVNKLIDVMRPHVGDPLPAAAASSTVPAPLSSAPPALSQPSSSSGPNKALIIGIAAAIVVVAAILYLVFGRSSGATLTATIIRNPRLSTLQSPVSVSIDDKPIGQIHSNPNGSSPLQFHVTAGEHTFKFSDAQAQSDCTGTFSVNANQTKFLPRMKDGGTACALDPAVGGS